MTDITTTTTTAVDPARGELVLVTLTPAYATSWESPASLRARVSAHPQDVGLRTFYATRHHDASDIASDYITLVVPEADDRSAGMWRLHGERYGLTLNDPHRGWDVRKAHVTPATPADGSEVPSGPSGDAPAVTFTQDEVDRLVREAREAKDREFEQWKEHANDIAIEYARENDLCGEFERCMEEIGFRGRESDYCVTFTVNVTARDEDHAAEVAAEVLYNDSLYDLTTFRFSEAEEI